MPKFLSTLLAAIAFLNLSAQRPTADEIKTDKGDLIIQPIFHSCLVLTWNNKTIYVDPYGGAKALEGIKSPDLVLITDIHQDHLNPETWEVVDFNKAHVIGPQAVGDKIPGNLKGNFRLLANGSTMDWQDIVIEAVPMYNLPEEPDSKHTKGRGNGYILTIGGKRIYISGDTEDIKEMRALKNIDVAFVCMNLPYTMDINQAASAVAEFKPKVVYPFHYRGQEGFSDVKAFSELVKKNAPEVEVRLREWYPKY